MENILGRAGFLGDNEGPGRERRPADAGGSFHQRDASQIGCHHVVQQHVESPGAVVPRRYRTKNQQVVVVDQRIRAGFVVSTEYGLVLVEGDQQVAFIQGEAAGAGADRDVRAYVVQCAQVHGVSGERIEVHDHTEIAVGGGPEVEVWSAEFEHVTLAPAAGQTVGPWGA